MDAELQVLLSGAKLNIDQIAAGVKILKRNLLKQPSTNIAELWKEHKLVHQTLDIVTQKQKDARSEDYEEPLNHPRTDEDLAKFLKWADKEKIIHHDVDLVRSPELGGFALKAKRAIKKGEEILRVPKAAMITSETARASDILKHVNTQNGAMWEMDNVVLAIYLCCEKLAHSSRWQPYIKMLPTDFNLPLFFTEEALEKMKPSLMFEEAITFYRQIARQFCIIFEEVYEVFKYDRIKKKSNVTPPLLFKTPLNVYNFTFDTYRWAVACVSTRVNQVPRINWRPVEEANLVNNDVSRTIPALIPLFDFASHEYSPDSTKEGIKVGYDDKNHVAAINAHRDFEDGDITPIYYGKRSNIDFFLYNGFVPEENPNDYYRLKLPIPAKDKLYPQKAKFYYNITSKVPSKETFIFEIGMEDNPIPWHLFYLTKIIVSEDPARDFKDPKTVMKAVDYLKNRFMILGLQYKKIKEGADDYERLIARILHAEKDILENAEEFCTGWLRKLTADAEWSAANPGVDRPRDSGDPYDYVQDEYEYHAHVPDDIDEDPAQ